MGTFAQDQGNPAIQEWLDALVESDRCWWCGQKSRFGAIGHGMEVHHIARKSHVRAGVRDHACNLFLSHTLCHSAHLGSADQAVVLARKLIHDPEHFHLGEWVSLCGKGRDFVTMRDIVRHLEVRR